MKKPPALIVIKLGLKWINIYHNKKPNISNINLNSSRREL